MAHVSSSAAQSTLAAGTALDCAQYYTHHPSSLIEQPQPNQATAWSQVSCESIAERFSVDIEHLLRWNPSLSRSACVLQPGVKYCVVQIEQSEKPSTTSLGDESGDPPICTFDPKKGEYVCPEPPICRFDPKKGEYVCPESTPTGGAGPVGDEDNSELK
ncbi:hypothetical protein C7974DRAFT_420005 [Boeremia exigua]|uniref:uncharacterized protein n=1 Tax=Boeremia exigua TaxID=749465 RepID=UPI001E8E225D|nr:uncharacterized protein C7974DRAFT_420005 [Boeremia exigua]KAH6644530.1 hypothetical protein C7974DRAFT_420005 [Boeremia exigua]